VLAETAASTAAPQADILTLEGAIVDTRPDVWVYVIVGVTRVSQLRVPLTDRSAGRHRREAD
jgi:hypothetical protein